MSERQLPITGLTVGSVTPSVIVCGDPARADRIAAHLDSPERLSDRREYRAYRGTHAGLPVTVCSHGVGAPGAAITFEELIAAGARRIVRVGSCGGTQPGLDAGSIVIASAAVQHTGFGREYAPPGYPAAADPALTLTLMAAAKSGGRGETRTGIVISRDVFYGGVETSDTPSYAALSRANVLAVEMECAALFLVGLMRGVPTAAILAVDGNVLTAAESMDSYAPGRPIVHQAIEDAIGIALEALRAAS